MSTRRMTSGSRNKEDDQCCWGTDPVPPQQKSTGPVDGHLFGKEEKAGVRGGGKKEDNRVATRRRTSSDNQYKEDKRL